MDEAWEQLIEMGLPDGAPHRRAAACFSDERVREALASIDLDRLDPSRREPLLAWLRGYRHHWPTRWAAELGPAGDALIEAIEALGIDDNRYLKLRRIAIAHLAELI